MWILKHVELVYDVELRFTELRQLVDLFLLFAAFGLLLLLLDLPQFEVNFVLDGAVPAPDLAVVEGGKDAALWVEGCELEGGDGGVRPVGDRIDASQEHIVFGGVRHWISLQHAEED